MSRGVMFDGIHSYDDLDLILKHIDIETPKPKVQFLEIEGADGVEDVTNALTDVTFFNNRKLTFTFARASDFQSYEILIPKVLNMLHGKRMKIVLDDDNTWYYDGRVYVDEADSNRIVDEFTVSCDCSPYKMSVSKCVKRHNVDGSANGSIDYLGSKVVTPTLECQIYEGKTLQLVLNGTTYYSLANGVNIVPDFLIKSGINSYSFVGNGYVTLSYVMGVL